MCWKTRGERAIVKMTANFFNSKRKRTALIWDFNQCQQYRKDILVSVKQEFMKIVRKDSCDRNIRSTCHFKFLDSDWF